jgi:phosphoribosylamine--glycine ligase
MSRVLVIGAGAREHALAWACAKSPEVSEVCTHGLNAAALWSLKNTPGLAPITEWEVTAWPELAERARRERVTLAVVGPDQALFEGAADALRAVGVPTFGPGREGARIEWSKAFAKELMEAAGVPTARARVFTSLGALEASLPQGACVLKADGLALGKGVEVCADRAQALSGARRLFGISKTVILEEFLTGEELSWLALTDGEALRLLEPARDHKRLKNGDQGPNTGGMGAYAPVTRFAAWRDRVRREVFEPILREFKRRKIDYRGVLYAGLMVDPARESLHVLEFNARFGDPECEVLLPRIDTDLVPWLRACAEARLAQMPEEIPVRKGAGVYVVAAAPGYPESPEKGAPIALPTQWVDARGLPQAFFAGISGAPGSWKVSGGRVLGCYGEGATLAQARTEAYERMRAWARFEGAQIREDIAG